MRLDLRHFLISESEEELDALEDDEEDEDVPDDEEEEEEPQDLMDLELKLAASLSEE